MGTAMVKILPHDDPQHYVVIAGPGPELSPDFDTDSGSINLELAQRRSPLKHSVLNYTRADRPDMVYIALHKDDPRLAKYTIDPAWGEVSP